MTTNAGPKSIAFVFTTPPSCYADGAEASRLVQSGLARLGLTRLVVVAVQGPRMPVADRANPSNVASRRLPCAQAAVQLDVAAALSP